jgi:dihydroorotate dehydrogenase (fumarate)
VVRSVVHAVKIPVSVKLTPFYASVPSFAKKLADAGARGLVVFNRFYQPDVDLDELDVDRQLRASTSADLPLRLHGLALLSPISSLSLACTGGVHSGLDAAKAILCGAHVVQLASVLLERGPGYLAEIERGLRAWLDEKGYETSASARGILDLRGAPDRHAWERLNYVKMLDGWQERGFRR